MSLTIFSRNSMTSQIAAYATEIARRVSIVNDASKERTFTSSTDTRVKATHKRAEAEVEATATIAQAKSAAMATIESVEKMSTARAQA